jgi:hypothetical protein
MSPLIVLALVFALAALAVVVFVAVVLAIHSEPNNQMTTRAQNPLAAMVRRLLGVHVSKPADNDVNDNREECLTGNSTDWWNKSGWDR